MRLGLKIGVSIFNRWVGVCQFTSAGDSRARQPETRCTATALGCRASGQATTGRDLFLTLNKPVSPNPRRTSVAGSGMTWPRCVPTCTTYENASQVNNTGWLPFTAATALGGRASGQATGRNLFLKVTNPASPKPKSTSVPGSGTTWPPVPILTPSAKPPLFSNPVQPREMVS